MVSEFSKTVDDFQVVQKQEKEKTKEQVVRDRKSVKRYKVCITVFSMVLPYSSAK